MLTFLAFARAFTHRPLGCPRRSLQNPRDLRKKHPTEILRKAVRGMLPKNKLKALRERNLLVYADDEGLKKHRAQLKGKEPTDLDFV